MPIKNKMVAKVARMTLMFLRRHQETLLVFGILWASIAVRLCGFDFSSHDMHGIFIKLFDFLSAHGGLRAFANPEVYDYLKYPFAYRFILAALTHFPFSLIPAVYAIKGVSCLFDYILAYLACKIVQIKYPKGHLPLFAFFAVLFCPTVILNSAVWGQSDSIYTAGVVACIYFLLRRKILFAILAFGLAINFKGQALFFAPVLFVLFLRREIKFGYLLMLPIMFVLFSIVPLLFSGMSPATALLFYPRILNTLQDQLSMNSISIYQFIPDKFYGLAVPAALCFTSGLILIMSYAFSIFKRPVNKEVILQISLLSLLVLPFFLPKMHDRYFYPAEIVAIIYAFYFPKYFFLPVLIIFSSLSVYFKYLFDIPILPRELLIYPVGISIILVTRHALLYNKSYLPDDPGCQQDPRHTVS